MKINRVIPCILAAAWLMSGSLATAKESPEQQRGWIGGVYERAKSRCTAKEMVFGADHTRYFFPSTLAKSQSAGFLVTSLATNTPAYQAGLRPGDLILELDHQPVTDWPAFSKIITSANPGAPLPVKTWRNGTSLDYQLTVGCEKFRPLHYFTVALPGFWGRFHPVPTSEAPSFSLVALGYQQVPGPQMEFGAVEEQFDHQCWPKHKQTGYDTDWRCWLVIFELKKGKQILAQEVVPAGSEKTL